MDLRRRSKNRVAEAMARIVALLPIGQRTLECEAVGEHCNRTAEVRGSNRRDFLVHRIAPGHRIHPLAVHPPFPLHVKLSFRPSSGH
jgi:hypothetical protein